MTTFIDFRYSRALAAALFAGQEQEEVDFTFPGTRDGFAALDIGSSPAPRPVAALVDRAGSVATTIDIDAQGSLSICDARTARLLTVAPASQIVALRFGPRISGIRAGDAPEEIEFTPFASGQPLTLVCQPGVAVMGRGSGRAARWGQLFYERPVPRGLCVNLTMDWHHLRSGIPLFGTMTAEELIEAGQYRLRFRSYAHDETDSHTSDFSRLFGCDAPADIAVHLSPALYLRSAEGLPNMAYTVTESERVHPSLVDRCNRTDRTCVPSTFVRDVFRRAGVGAPLDVVHHGVDTAFFKPAARRQPLPGGRGFNFLAIGTHVERKNFKHLVRAFLEEFREHEDVALFLLLRPEYLTTQNNIALEFTDWERTWGRKSAPILFWTGYVTREHLRDFYANADAYVMPSNEGFGLTLLEAMACGTPAIALNYGGVTDFVTSNNGILVPIGKQYVAGNTDTLPYVGDVFFEPDLPLLRAGMRRLFEDRGLTARLSRRARADAEQFSWTDVSKQFVRSLQQTYEEWQKKRVARTSRPIANTSTAPLTVALCVLDDVDVRGSLTYLQQLSAELKDIRVLCLFTRYADLRQVNQARDFGFAFYRWDGTPENVLVIARNLMEPGWILVLNPGEQLIGSAAQLLAFASSQPTSVTEIALRTTNGPSEPRLFSSASNGDAGSPVEYGDVSIVSRMFSW